MTVAWRLLRAHLRLRFASAHHTLALSSSRSLPTPMQLVDAIAIRLIFSSNRRCRTTHDVICLLRCALLTLSLCSQHIQVVALGMGMFRPPSSLLLESHQQSARGDRRIDGRCLPIVFAMVSFMYFLLLNIFYISPIPEQIIFPHKRKFQHITCRPASHDGYRWQYRL